MKFLLSIARKRLKFSEIAQPGLPVSYLMLRKISLSSEI